MKNLKQKHYPSLEIDVREKDIIMLWQRGEVVQIERENIEQLISIIKSRVK